MKPVYVRVMLMAAVLVGLLLMFLLGRHSASSAVTQTAGGYPTSITAPLPEDTDPTQVYAHNLELRKGPHFRVYIRWLRGLLVRTNPHRNASFDVPESFLVEIQKGVVNVKLSDISDFLNNESATGAPLRNITMENEGGELRLHGTVHKVVSLPVRLDGTLTPMPDGRLRYHLNKLNVLKMPMKGLLGMFHVTLSDVIKNTKTPGVVVQGNDIYFDTQELLPPPHIRGQITSVTPNGDSLTVTYGGAKNDEEKLARWHNFLRLSGGSLDFGKLTMRQVDLTMIDATDDPWFDLDLVNYQAQLVYGTTRMTEKQGLEIYMPDVDKVAAKTTTKGVSVDWLKDKSAAPPVKVPGK